MVDGSAFTAKRDRDELMKFEWFMKFAAMLGTLTRALVVDWSSNIGMVGLSKLLSSGLVWNL